MKFHSILFSTEMVQAILEGCKTQTRRVIKPQPPINCFDEEPLIQFDNGIKKGTEVNSELYVEWECDFPEGQSVVESHCVYSIYGKPGDVLWVREKFCWMDASPSNFAYAADYGPEPVDWKWKPSIHMPKAACRIFLEIKNIRVERLQQISEGDAQSEGVLEYENDGYYKNYFKQKGLRTQDGVECMTAIASFQSLWCSINSLESWKDNPWVWVIEFERIEKPQNFQ